MPVAMFSQSGTNTPIPSNVNVVQYHEQLGETVTWVKDWYSPNLTSNSSEDGISDSVRLKGWFRTNMNHKNSSSLSYSHQDVLDLNQWRYHKTSIHAVESTNSVSDSTGLVDTNEESQAKVSSKELESAIKFSAEEGLISGLG